MPELVELQPGYIHPALEMRGLERLRRYVLPPDATQVQVPLPTSMRRFMREGPLSSVTNHRLCFDCITVQSHLDPTEEIDYHLWRCWPGHRMQDQLDPVMGEWFWQGFIDQYGRTVMRRELHEMVP